jgi:folate-binding protein YgfZ
MDAYQFAIDQAGFYLIPQSGFFYVSGADRKDFLQRQTTNNLKALLPGQTQLNVLTSPTARILDVFYVFLVDDDALRVASLPGRSAATLAFLQSRIFFMDKVLLEDVSASFAQVELLGGQVDTLLKRLGIELPGSEEALVVQQLADETVRLWRTAGRLGLGYRLLFPAASFSSITQILEQSGMIALDEPLYQLLNIEAGQPTAEHGLTEKYTPLETGLATAISYSKGCYTGQEVIARQTNYDKVTQQLCGVKLAAAAPAGTPLWVEGRQVGVITSSGRSPRFGDIALAIVKRPHHQTGANLWVGETEQASLPAVVAALPFK